MSTLANPKIISAHRNYSFSEFIPLTEDDFNIGSGGPLLNGDQVSGNQPVRAARGAGTNLLSSFEYLYKVCGNGSLFGILKYLRQIEDFI